MARSCVAQASVRSAWRRQITASGAEDVEGAARFRSAPELFDLEHGLHKLSPLQTFLHPGRLKPLLVSSLTRLTALLLETMGPSATGQLQALSSLPEGLYRTSRECPVAG